MQTKRKYPIENAIAAFGFIAAPLYVVAVCMGLLS